MTRNFWEKKVWNFSNYKREQKLKSLEFEELWKSKNFEKLKNLEKFKYSKSKSLISSNVLKVWKTLKNKVFKSLKFENLTIFNRLNA